MAGKCRVKIRCENVQPFWMLINIKTCPLVSDIQEQISNKLGDTFAPQLLLDGCVIPPYESSELLRDNDTLHVRSCESSAKILSPQTTVPDTSFDETNQFHHHHNSESINQSDFSIRRNADIFSQPAAIHDKASLKRKQREDEQESYVPSDLDSKKSDNGLTPTLKSKKRKKHKKEEKNSFEETNDGSDAEKCKSDSDVSTIQKHKKKKKKEKKNRQDNQNAEKPESKNEESMSEKGDAKIIRSQCLHKIVASGVEMIDTLISTMPNPISPKAPTANLSRNEKSMDSSVDGPEPSSNDHPAAQKKKRNRRRKKHKKDDSTSLSGAVKTQAAMPARNPAPLRLPKWNQPLSKKTVFSSDEDAEPAPITTQLADSVSQSQSQSQNHTSSHNEVNGKMSNSLLNDSNGGNNFRRREEINSRNNDKYSQDTWGGVNCLMPAEPASVMARRLPNGAMVYTRKRGFVDHHPAANNQTAPKVPSKPTSNGTSAAVPAVTGSLGREKTSSSNIGGESSPALPGVQTALLALAAGPAPRNYNALPDLTTRPKAGDVIAYKVLELGDGYIPGISDYKEAEVVSFEAASLQVTLRVLQAESGKRKPGRFDLPEDMTDESELVEVGLSALLELKLVSSS